MTTPKPIFFDLDGTLTNPESGIVRCIEYALDRLAVPYSSDDDFRRFIGPPLRASFANLVGEELADEAVRLYRVRFDDCGWRENDPYPGISTQLQALRDRGHTLFVATSKPQVFADRIIDHFELRPYFDAVYGSELDGTRSGKVDLLRHALAETQSPPGATMVGDRRHDVEGARANGLRAVGVTYGFGSAQELTEAGAELLINSPQAVAEALLG
ncbi:MAG: HAD hydrolase-like protein [Pseudomonadota bacterium]